MENTGSEAFARKHLIDPALARAGWSVDDRSRVGIEIPVDGYDSEPWNGITDYILLRDTGEVIAVVEAKRQTRSPQVAREQVRHYVTEIAKHQSFAPFAFLTNGIQTYFWDTFAANPRMVSGFFSISDLENRLSIRQSGRVFREIAIAPEIASRSYQQEAIRRVLEAFDAGKRRALIVMATGTGKTRTAMGIIDLMFRANRARRVLFLADRDALVQQALGDGFRVHLPNEPSERIYTATIDLSKRLYVSTLQTMSRCFDRFGPGFFDLIIFDEAHRSIFNKFAEVFEYFDSWMIGLTATPAQFIDRDTFRVFDCSDGTPTFLYTYDQGVDDGILANFVLYKAQTRFQRHGIRGVDLSDEERNALIEQGLDPDDLDFSGTDLERDVSNLDTLRKQWEEIMDVCIKDESGQLPGKTIIFAITQAHAVRLLESFESMYPQYIGMIEVITHDVERVRDGSYGDGLLTKFKKRNLPRLAISVDMLDTGVDIPEVTNLVFMKPVHSPIKLWQMIGRGTRGQIACKHLEWLPNASKTEFKILDFWENDFDKTEEEAERATVPVLVTIFNTRLKLLEQFIADNNSAGIGETVSDLRQMVARIPRESYSVVRVFEEIAEVWSDDFWLLLTKRKLDFLKFRVGPLLRLAAPVDVEAETFTSKIERLHLGELKNVLQPALIETIREDVSRLPEFVRQREHVSRCISRLFSDVRGDERDVSYGDIARTLAPLMTLRRAKPNVFLELDLPDYIDSRGYISLSEGGEKVYVAEYRARVEQAIVEVVESHPAIEAIRAGIEASDEQLVDLERTLRFRLDSGPIQLSEENIRRAYGLKVGSLSAFVRHLLSLDIPDYASIVERRFDSFIAQHNFGSDQIRFLRAIQSVFLQKRKLERADLYVGALKSFGDGAVDRILGEQVTEELLELTDSLAA